LRREPGTCCRDLVEIERYDICENWQTQGSCV
jgi:hypothetical protein